MIYKKIQNDKLSNVIIHNINFQSYRKIKGKQFKILVHCITERKCLIFFLENNKLLTVFYKKRKKNTLILIGAKQIKINKLIFRLNL